MERLSIPSLEHRIEEFIRTQFSVDRTDPGFSREADLFEGGYVDSMGIVELLEFLQKEFKVEIPDDELLTDDFSSITGMARIVSRCLESRPGLSRVAK
jgi:acyl carrier protein